MFRKVFSQVKKGENIGSHIVYGFLGVVVMATMITISAIMMAAFMPTKIASEKLSSSEFAHIDAQLKQRTAGDCVIEKVSYGWKCTEIETGKVYKIKGL